jgi:hypothetical protein
MWIHNTNEPTVRHYNADVLGDVIADPVAELPGDGYGIACDGPQQVRDDVGELLINHYDAYEPYSADDAATDS